MISEFRGIRVSEANENHESHVQYSATLVFRVGTAGWCRANVFSAVILQSHWNRYPVSGGSMNDREINEVILFVSSFIVTSFDLSLFYGDGSMSSSIGMNYTNINNTIIQIYYNEVYHYIDPEHH